MYDIKIDREHGVIDVTLGGMMSTDEVEAYVTDLKRAFIANKLHTYSMVIDVTECPIQQQDTIRAMAEHMVTMPKARSLAIVTGSSLARMQIRRLFTQPYARICSSVSEGREWVYRAIEPGIA